MRASAPSLFGRGCLSLIAACGLLACEDEAEPEAGEAQRLVHEERALDIESPAPPNLNALAEINQVTPKARPPTTGPDGTTLIGSDTGLPDNEPTAPAAPVQVDMSGFDFEPQLSSPVLERLGRQQLYWDLRACTLDGTLPPADSIVLGFTIRSDGNVDPASVRVTAVDPRYEKVAECVLRRFSTLPLRAPASSLGRDSRVLITWPSVD